MLEAPIVLYRFYKEFELTFVNEYGFLYLYEIN